MSPLVRTPAKPSSKHCPRLAALLCRAGVRQAENETQRLTSSEPSLFESLPDFSAIIRALRGWIMDRVDAALAALSTCLLLVGATTLTIAMWL
jgi:hypothetical protein